MMYFTIFYSTKIRLPRKMFFNWIFYKAQKLKNAPLDFNDINPHKIEVTQKLKFSAYVKFERHIKMDIGKRKP